MMPEDGPFMRWSCGWGLLVVVRPPTSSIEDTLVAPEAALKIKTDVELWSETVDV